MRTMPIRFPASLSMLESAILLLASSRRVHPSAVRGLVGDQDLLMVLWMLTGARLRAAPETRVEGDL